MTVLAAALLAAAAVGLSPSARRRAGRVFGGYPTERSARSARSAVPQRVALRPVAPSLWLGRWFGRRHRRPPGDLPPALALDLVAAVLDAGAPPGAAIGLVAAAVAAAGGSQAAELAAAAVGCDGAAGGAEAPEPGRLVTLLRDLTRLSGQTGLPLADLVRAAAEDQRREGAAAHAVAVRRLAVLLVLPTGLCLLPAFLLLGVVPLVIDLLTAA